MTQFLLKTPLFDWHVAHGSRLVEFGGWEMPVQYSTVMDEHLATRSAVTITDVSHMGRLFFFGLEASHFLETFLTRRIDVIKPGQVRYSLITNENGGIVDDVLIGRFESPAGEPFYLLVVNASNRTKVIPIIKQRLTSGVSLEDRTLATAMFAVQGPKALPLLQTFTETDLSAVKYYNGCSISFHHPDIEKQPFLITRTGYTGEDGFELYVDADVAEPVWNAILEAGRPFGLRPCGLGARDTLRLEAALPLYGHEMSETINPYEAGLEYAVYLDGPAFPGSKALQELAKTLPSRKRVGLELEGKRPARENCGIFAGDRQIGIVTSGSFAPTLQKPIAMGYVSPEFAQVGTMLEIDIRGKRHPAQVVPLPFYKREK